MHYSAILTEMFSGSKQHVCTNNQLHVHSFLFQPSQRPGVVSSTGLVPRRQLSVRNQPRPPVTAS